MAASPSFVQVRYMAFHMHDRKILIPPCRLYLSRKACSAWALVAPRRPLVNAPDCPECPSVPGGAPRSWPQDEPRRSAAPLRIKVGSAYDSPGA